MELSNQEGQIKTALIYGRVSDDDQLKGLSMDVQKELCEKWADKNNFKVIGTYKDEAKSGTTTAGRHGLEDMIIHSQREHVDAVLIIDTDRFARDEEDHFAMKVLLRKGGTRIIAINQPMIDESPEGRLMETMLIGINAFYSRLTGRKVKKSLEKKWEDGWWPGWAPIGYLNTNIGTEDNPINVIEIDPIRGPLIAEMFELYSTGNYSFLKLKNMMFEKGLTSRTGKMLSIGSTQQIIVNTFYYGWMKWSGMEKVGNHKALITKSMFDRCLYIAAKNRLFLIRERKHTFLLRGFVRCPVHDRRLTAEWHHLNSKKRDKISYYHCTHVGGCKSSYIESGKLEKAVSKLFKRFEFSPEFVELVHEGVKRHFDKNKQGIRGQKQSLINQRKALVAKREKLEDLLIDGIVDRNTFKRKHQLLQSQITQIDNLTLGLEGKHQIDVSLIDEVLALTRNIYQTYLDAPEHLKRHYLRFFFESVYIKDKKITKVIETPIFVTLKQAQKVLILNNWLLGHDSNVQP